MSQRSAFFHTGSGGAVTSTNGLLAHEPVLIGNWPCGSLVMPVRALVNRSKPSLVPNELCLVPLALIIQIRLPFASSRSRQNPIHSDSVRLVQACIPAIVAVPLMASREKSPPGEELLQDLIFASTRCLTLVALTPFCSTTPHVRQTPSPASVESSLIYHSAITDQ